MPGRARPLLFTAAVALALFAASTIAGYVYSHEPARDALVVEFTGTPSPSPAHLSGSVVSIEGGTLRLATVSGGERTIMIPDDVPTEDFQRLSDAMPEGAQVNVGVDDTSFGQVLTGVVAIEVAP